MRRCAPGPSRRSLEALHPGIERVHVRLVRVLRSRHVAGRRVRDAQRHQRLPALLVAVARVHQRCSPGDLAIVLAVLQAGLRRALPLARLADPRPRLRVDQAAGHGLGGGAQEMERVDAALIGVPSEVLVALAELDGDGVPPHARVAPHRRAHRPLLAVHFRGDFEDVAVVQAQPVGRGRVDLDPRVPGELADGVRQFLEPRPVGQAPVPEAVGRVDDEVERVIVVGTGERGFGDAQGAQGLGIHGGRAGSAPAVAGPPSPGRNRSAATRARSPRTRRWRQRHPRHPAPSSRAGSRSTWWPRSRDRHSAAGRRRAARRRSAWCRTPAPSRAGPAPSCRCAARSRPSSRGNGGPAAAGPPCGWSRRAWTRRTQ
jgi:hypothetical protein